MQGDLEQTCIYGLSGVRGAGGPGADMNIWFIRGEGGPRADMDIWFIRGEG